MDLTSGFGNICFGMKLNPPSAHRSQIKICEKRQMRNVQFRFMQNAFRILKPIQKSSKRVWVFCNTGANAFAKNQTRLVYEDKRDLYCKTNTSFNSYCWLHRRNIHILFTIWPTSAIFGSTDNVYYRTRPRYLMINGCAKCDDRSSNNSKVIALLWQRNENLWWWRWRRRQNILSSKTWFLI